LKYLLETYIFRSKQVEDWTSRILRRNLEEREQKEECNNVNIPTIFMEAMYFALSINKLDRYTPIYVQTDTV